MRTKVCTKCEARLSYDRFSLIAGTSRHHSWCKECVNAKTRRYSRSHREQENATRRARVAANPEKHRASLEILRSNNLLRNYGITAAERDEIERQQGGRCAACGCIAAPKARRMAVDHDHLTGKIRGLLCSGCNQAIGKLKDSIGNTLKVAAYLTRTSSVESFVLSLPSDETPISIEKNLKDVIAVGAMISAVAQNGWRRPSA